MTEQEILDIDALMQPISEDAPSGVNVRSLGVFDEIKALRTTESADSMVGTLRAGEYKTANWGKVVTLCVKELRERTKDLQLAVWLAEALTRVHGMAGMSRGLELVLRLNQNFWPTYFPPIEDGGLDMRAGRLAEMERLLKQSIEQSLMTSKVDGEAHAWWEWKQIQILYLNAGRAKPEERSSIEGEANAKKDVFEKAIAKSTWEFYDDILQALLKSGEILSQLRETVDQLFQGDPTFYDMEDSVTGFSELRKEMDEFRVKIESILDEKPAPPGKGRNAQPQETAAAEAGSSENGGGTGRGSGGSGQVETRADALRRLQEIAEFFSRTEPHSPVSYLVNRAVRWGEMPLENWLDEVIPDPTMLNTLRETLGLPKKEPTY